MYTVLIVDDEPMALNLIRLALDWKDYGFSSIITTTSPNDALHILKTRRIDIALVDISMPEMSGLELLRKSKEQGLNTRFVIVSAYSEFDYARSAVNLGAIGYFLKPIQRDNMMSLLSLKREALIAHQLSDKRFRETILKELINPDELLNYLGLSTQADYYHLVFISQDNIDEYEKVCKWSNSDDVQMYFIDESTAVFICAASVIPEPTLSLSCDSAVVIRGLTKEELIEIIKQPRDIALLLLNESILYINKISRSNDIFIKILDYVQRNYQKDISLSLLSKKFNVNYSYCSFLFKEATGTNYSSYIKCLRLQHALKLLSYSDLSINQISYESGFKDSHYFNNAFKKLTGLTPSQYRQENLKGSMPSKHIRAEYNDRGHWSGEKNEEN